MMDNNKKTCGDDCNCSCHDGMCKCGTGSCCGSMCSGIHGYHHPGFHVLRWILIVILVCIVLSIGIKIGEFKAIYMDGAEGWNHSMRMTYPVNYGTNYGYDSYSNLPQGGGAMGQN